MNEIKFQVTKAPLAKGILLVILSLCFEGAIIPDFIAEGGAGIIALVIGNVIFLIPMLIIGILNLVSYHEANSNMKAKLEKLGKTAILSHIQFASERIHQSQRMGSRVTSFTDVLIVDPQSGIVDYNEIDQIYKSEYSRKGYITKNLTLELIDGSQVVVAYGADDAQIADYIQLCYMHNPKMMVGYTDEFNEKHSKNVETYKRGTIIIPALELGVLTGPMRQ